MKSIKITLLAIALIILYSCSKEASISEPGALVPKTVDQDPSLPAIMVNGVMLHSEAFGNPDSTMIVCIHGGPGGDYRYLLKCKQLAEYGFRVVFYDQIGSGLSQRFSQDYYSNKGLRAVDMMYDELGSVIEHYRSNSNQKIILFGHSWGAILATGFAGKYPHAINGLVVCEPGGLKWDDINDYIKESRSFNVWSEMLNDATYMDQFITGDKNDQEIVDYKFGLLASKNEITGEDNTLPGSTWRSGSIINKSLNDIGKEYSPDFSYGIQNFNIPTLFFYSEKNKAYTDDWAAKISSAYTVVTRIKVAGVGHDGIVTDQNAWSHVTLPNIINYINSL